MIVLHLTNLKTNQSFNKEFVSLHQARNYIIKIVKGGYLNIVCDNFDCDFPYEYQELIYWYYRQPNKLINRRTK